MIYKKLSKEVLIYGINSGLKALVPVLIIPILTRYLSPSEYGTLSLIEVSILFILPFITLNCSGAIKVEFFKLNHTELRNYISDAIGISILSFLTASLFFFAISEYLSQLLDLPSFIIVLLPVFVILRLISTIVGVLLQVQQKALHFASFTLFQTIIDFSLSILFVVLYKFGFLGRLAGTYGAFLIATGIGFLLLYRMKLINFRPKFKYVKDILRFGIPLIPHTIGGAILAMSDRYFIIFFEGNENVGYYTVAYQLSALMLLVATSVNLAWTPFLFKHLKEGTPAAYKIIKDVLKVLIILFLGVGLCVYLGSDLLFYIFSDPSFYSAKDFFPFLLIGFVFQSLYTIFSVFLFYEKKTFLLAKITMGGAILNLILNYYFILEFSTIGVAYATAITWGVFCLIIVSVVVTQLKLYKRKL